MTTPLITRLEEAAEGSRELDGMLARHFGRHRVEPRFARNKHGGWIAPEDFFGVNSDGSPRLDGLHGTDIHRDPPRLSQSIDAAYALAERVLGRVGARICLAQVVGCRLQGDEPVVPGIARALCSAVLRTTFRANHKDKP